MVALMVFCKCWGDSRELLVSLERSLPALAANAVNIPLWQVSSSRPNHVFFVHICHKFLCSRVCGLGVSMVHSILKHCVRMCPWMGGSRAWKDPRQKPAVEATPTGDIFPAFHLPGSLAALYLHLVQGRRVCVQNYFHYDRSVSETTVTVKSLAMSFRLNIFLATLYITPQEIKFERKILC